MGQLIIHFTQQSSLYFAYNLSLTAWGRCQKCPCIPKQLGDSGRILFYITFTPCSPLGILCKSLIPNSCQYFGLSDFHRNLREIYSTSLLCKFKTYPLRFQKQSVARDTIKKSGTILHCFQILTDYFFPRLTQRIFALITSELFLDVPKMVLNHCGSFLPVVMSLWESSHNMKPESPKRLDRPNVLNSQ